LEANRFKAGLDISGLKDEARLSRLSVLLVGVLCSGAALLGGWEQYGGQGGVREVGTKAWGAFVVLSLLFVFCLCVRRRRLLRFLTTDEESLRSLWLVVAPF